MIFIDFLKILWYNNYIRNDSCFYIKVVGVAHKNKTLPRRVQILNNYYAVADSVIGKHDIRRGKRGSSPTKHMHDRRIN
jgi:hypothetical protein